VFRKNVISVDFAFWESNRPLEDDEAEEIYLALTDTGRHPKVAATGKIAVMVDAIYARWPMPAKGNEDDWPFASPLDVSESHLIVCISSSRLWDVWPFVGDLAKQHELVMFDPQQECVFLPKRLSQKRTRERAKKKRKPD
jgi:hypothetical protein